MTLQDTSFVHIDHAIAHLSAPTVEDAFAELAETAALETGLSATFLRDRLQQQGDRARASLDDGVRIAHLRVPQLSESFVVVGRADRAIAADAGENADLLILMLSPVRDIAGHLHRLARLTRLFRSETFRASLRSAPNAGALCDFIGLADRESQAA